jgi:hypothetical protein
MIKDLALALTPSAPARLKSEDKKVLEGLGVTFCASLSDDVRHKRADAGLVKTAHSLVEQGKERVAETFRRELCMPVLASPATRERWSVHQHASSWRVAAVRSCDAGLVDHAEWPKKLSVCKRTVARLPLGCSMQQYMRVQVHYHAGKAGFKISIIFTPQFHQFASRLWDKHRISKSELFSFANDKDAIPAKAETTDYIY